MLRAFRCSVSKKFSTCNPKWNENIQTLYGKLLHALHPFAHVLHWDTREHIDSSKLTALIAAKDFKMAVNLCISEYLPTCITRFGEQHPICAQILSYAAKFSIHGFIVSSRATPSFYSPSKDNRKMLIKAMQYSIDAVEYARNITMCNDLESKFALSDTLVIAGQVLSTVAHIYGQFNWRQTHDKVLSVANAVATNAIETVKRHICFQAEKRMKEKAARDSFEAEVKRLESLNLTVLKKEMAALRQQYRKHKRRGRPGKRDMISTKAKIDELQLDIDYVTGRRVVEKSSGTVENLSPQLSIEVSEDIVLDLQQEEDDHIDTSKLFNTALSNLSEAREIQLLHIKNGLPCPELCDTFRSIANLYFRAAQVAESDGSNQVGLNLEPLSMLNRCIENFEKAMQLASENGEQESTFMARTLAECAAVYSHRSHDGDKSEAFILFRESLSIFDRLDLGNSRERLEVQKVCDEVSMFNGYKKLK